MPKTPSSHTPSYNTLTTLVPLILLFQCLICRGQTSIFSQHVNIKALSYRVSHDRYYSFNIDIYRHNEDIKIIYSVLDSSKAKQLFNVWYSASVDSPITTFINIDSIASKRSLYQKDSISFSLKFDHDFQILLDSAFLKDGHQFENQKPEWVHIDGVIYHFIFKKNGKFFKSIGTISPSPLDYPILEQLIAASFYRYKPNSSGFLNKDNTNGRYHKSYSR